MLRKIPATTNLMGNVAGGVLKEKTVEELLPQR